MLAIDGVPPTSKRRALRDLERRGLIIVERQSRKSPIVRLLT
jgi:DNA-binding transcriptional ArsR family regulator